MFAAHSILRFKSSSIYEKLSIFQALFKSAVISSSRQHRDDEPPTHTHTQKNRSYKSDFLFFIEGMRMKG